MRRMRKLASLLLAMVMVLSMTMTAFADEDTTHTITITNKTAEHTYEAYQVFVGNITGGKLTDLGWGAGVNGADLLAELKTLPAYANCKTAADVAGVLEGFNDNSTELDAFAQVVSKHLAAVAGTSTEAASPYTITVTGDGYYFIKDVDDTVPQNGTYTKFILKVTNNVSIVAKDGTTESDKKVKDVNDSTGETTGWQDSADYDIGDRVPFRLRGVVASDYDKYVDYYFAFHDTESKGLTFQPESVKVFIGTTEIKTGFEVVYPATDGHTFDVVFEDLKQIEGVSIGAGTEIFVYYESILNENAVIGNPGNPNEMYLEYDNNPNDEQDGTEEDTGKTPDDEVVVFTYETIIDKVDEDGKALTGATFTLEKKVKDEEAEGGFRWVAIERVEVTAGSTFEFTGLDDGDYRLTETDTPAGYNSIDPIEFTVTATHTVEQVGDTKIEVTELKVTPEGLFAAAVNLGTFEKLNGTNKDLTTGQIYTEIVNQSGAELPETGGMGTTLFYVFGTILVVGAAVVLVTKKRMSGIR